MVTGFAWVFDKNNHNVGVKRSSDSINFGPHPCWCFFRTCHRFRDQDQTLQLVHLILLFLTIVLTNLNLGIFRIIEPDRYLDHGLYEPQNYPHHQKLNRQTRNYLKRYNWVYQAQILKGRALGIISKHRFSEPRKKGNWPDEPVHFSLQSFEPSKICEIMLIAFHSLELFWTARLSSSEKSKKFIFSETTSKKPQSILGNASCAKFIAYFLHNHESMLNRFELDQNNNDSIQLLWNRHEKSRVFPRKDSI